MGETSAFESGSLVTEEHSAGLDELSGFSDLSLLVSTKGFIVSSCPRIIPVL